MGALRVYMDASVFGGYFDDEFSDVSVHLFDVLLRGKVVALISDTLVGELVDAPECVQDLLQQVLHVGVERIPANEEAEYLRDRYLAARILTAKYGDDALHVAHATVARADVIVSWNFRHLVNPPRIRAFNGVNIASGYGVVSIMTPADIVKIVEEDDDRP